MFFSTLEEYHICCAYYQCWGLMDEPVYNKCAWLQKCVAIQRGARAGNVFAAQKLAAVKHPTGAALISALIVRRLATPFVRGAFVGR